MSGRTRKSSCSQGMKQDFNTETCVRVCLWVCTHAHACRVFVIVVTTNEDWRSHSLGGSTDEPPLLEFKIWETYREKSGCQSRKKKELLVLSVIHACTRIAHTHAPRHKLVLRSAKAGDVRAATRGCYNAVARPTRDVVIGLRPWGGNGWKHVARLQTLWVKSSYWC